MVQAALADWAGCLDPAPLAGAREDAVFPPESAEGNGPMQGASTAKRPILGQG